MPAVSGVGPSVEEILADREVRGLRVPVVGRILLSGYGGVSLAFLADGSGFPAEAMWLALLVVSSLFCFNVVFYVLLRRGLYVSVVGVAAAIFDTLFCLAQLQILWVWGESADLPPGIIFMTEAPMFFVMMVLINALALRPRYPLIVTAGTTATLGIAAAAAMTDPRTVFAVAAQDVFRNAATDPTQVGNVLVLSAATGLVISYITHLARQTIRRAIASELERARVERDQLRVVMREKLQGLAALVAGISHEINTPIGVIKSGVDTQRRAIDKIEAEVGPDAAARAFRASREMLKAMASAADRIQKTETSLRALSHLDEGDFQRVDLHEEIDQVVGAVQREKGPKVEVRKEYSDDVPPLHLNAAEFNQALLTITRNAFEAIDGEGTVTIRTRVEDGKVRISIEDTGHGIPESKLPALFDVSLASREERVAAGFGLPAAQSILHRHGGHIEVSSRVGSGTTFEIWLPGAKENRAEARRK